MLVISINELGPRFSTMPSNKSFKLRVKLNAIFVQISIQPIFAIFTSWSLLSWP
uniref:Cka2 n=1 Tax=Arundo donax TaxID=35708 RepID=A0A0A9DY38_ARUDO